MKIYIFDYEFKCPKCQHHYKVTLEEENGFSSCPNCNYEFEWEINIDY